ncbi:transposase [Hyphomonas sp. CACIAM 19H1]|uniref:REP-associated tyrosine transposase n=1 Tax=Hyphomonas sp. CACIAM 19H1 TaxID=1873716 RepID=UPI000DF06E9F|nr:transposase [Hyphomonas sp. CACIAM 19H1]AXE65215.1 transposase [Hyphomonas sp. CACIAM 19H1]
MPAYRRLYIPGGTYFFTVNLADRSRRLLTDHVTALRQSWREVEQDHAFSTLAAVVLPDHLHVIWTLPPGDADFSTRLRLLKSGFTRRLRASGVIEGHEKIWQNRFWERAIRDDRDLENHINYVHFNPVKHGHVAEIPDWPYSTWRRYHAPDF